MAHSVYYLTFKVPLTLQVRQLEVPRTFEAQQILRANLKAPKGHHKDEDPREEFHACSGDGKYCRVSSMKSSYNLSPFLETGEKSSVETRKAIPSSNIYSASGNIPRNLVMIAKAAKRKGLMTTTPYTKGGTQESLMGRS